ncbi:hypothetical protein ABZW44_22375 [Streptomyces mirabilis]|uniref:hypothetical protein n=1 Tax=Streptomyces mirabilis TaxID=68239 RepID=UPI0033BFB783
MSYSLIPPILAEVMTAQDRAREAADKFINDLMDGFDRRWITGHNTGEPRGFLPVDDRPPTPAEKAMAILAPHLADEPLYQSIGTPL